jgi:citrate lyase subunit beta/citryl-CoA lyase
MALVETARGVAALPAIAASSPRLLRLSYGIADYSLDAGLEPGDDEAEIAWVRAALVQASRLAGLLPPVDSVVVQVRDGERFRDSAQRARRAGLRGKLCLHPDQVPIANAVFSPQPAEVARAEKIVAAFEAAEAAGSAAISVDGEFVDYPVAARAQALLELAARNPPAAP